MPVASCSIHDEGAGSTDGAAAGLLRWSEETLAVGRYRRHVKATALFHTEMQRVRLPRLRLRKVNRRGVGAAWKADGRATAELRVLRLPQGPWRGNRDGSWRGFEYRQVPQGMRFDSSPLRKVMEDESLMGASAFRKRCGPTGLGIVSSVFRQWRVDQQGAGVGC